MEKVKEGTYNLSNIEGTTSRSILQKQIEEMKAKLSEMEEELKKDEPFQFNYEGGVYFLEAYHVVGKVFDFELEYTHNYRYRKTKENAEAELLRNKQGNFIGALFEQIDENYAEGLKWNDTRQDKYSLYYNHNMEKWEICSANTTYRPSVTYTAKKEVINKALELFNSDKVKYPTN